MISLAYIFKQSMNLNLNLKKKLVNLYQSLYNSIAFYPMIISFLFTVIAIVLINIDSNPVVKWIDDIAPILIIKHAESARSLLSVIIGGIISLTVFSFSMVMLTLSQASSNFSPRILPGLVSERKNQLVLGCYLGTAIFSIIILLSVRGDHHIDSTYALPVLIAIIIFIYCIGLFIYFINNISTSIQIDNIVNNIYKSTLSELENSQVTDESNSHTKEIKKSTVVRSKSDVFYQGVITDEISKLCDEYKMNIYIKSHHGQFLHKGSQIYYCDIDLTTEQEEAIYDTLVLRNDHYDVSSFTSGFSQLTEVGVKAMSPGINDPGTAIITIDYLSSLFRARSMMLDDEYISSKSGNYTYVKSRMPFSVLLRDIVGQYRLYCAENLLLMLKLKKMLMTLSEDKNIRSDYKEVIDQQLDALVNDGQAHISNEFDLKAFLDYQ